MKEKKKDRRKKPQDKNIMVALLHRSAIKKTALSKTVGLALYIR